MKFAQGQRDKANRLIKIGADEASQYNEFGRLFAFALYNARSILISRINTSKYCFNDGKRNLITTLTESLITSQIY